MHSRPVHQAPPSGPFYSDEAQHSATPLTSALAHADDRPAPRPFGDTTARAPLSLPIPCTSPTARRADLWGRGVVPRRGTRSPRRLHPRACNAPQWRSGDGPDPARPPSPPAAVPSIPPRELVCRRLRLPHALRQVRLADAADGPAQGRRRERVRRKRSTTGTPPHRPAAAAPRWHHGDRCFT